MLERDPGVPMWCCPDEDDGSIRWASECRSSRFYYANGRTRTKSIHLRRNYFSGHQQQNELKKIPPSQFEKKEKQNKTTVEVRLVISPGKSHESKKKREAAKDAHARRRVGGANDPCNRKETRKKQKKGKTGTTSGGTQKQQQQQVLGSFKCKSKKMK